MEFHNVFSTGVGGKGSGAIHAENAGVVVPDQNIDLSTPVSFFFFFNQQTVPGKLTQLPN